MVEADRAEEELGRGGEGTDAGPDVRVGADDPPAPRVAF
jgi:hypothetical protein